jgi:hypothetical protein
MDRLALSTTLAISGENNDRIEGDASGLGIITNAVGNQPLFPIRAKAISPASTTACQSQQRGARHPEHRRDARHEHHGECRAALGDAPGAGVHFPGRPGPPFPSRGRARITASPGNVCGQPGWNFILRANHYQEPLPVRQLRHLEPEIGGRHAFEVTGGNSVELSRTQFNLFQAEDLTSPELQEVNNTREVTAIRGNAQREQPYIPFLPANYRLDGKYLVGVSARTDASSKFAGDNKWAFFPAVSAGWVLSQEPFLKGNRRFDFLKLRASYGSTGNQAIGDYDWQGIFATYNYGNSSGLAQLNPENPRLSWETTRQARHRVRRRHVRWASQHHGGCTTSRRPTISCSSSRSPSLPESPGARFSTTWATSRTKASSWASTR